MEQTDVVDLENVILSHYRLSEIKRQDLILRDPGQDCRFEPGSEMVSACAKDKKEEFLSQIIDRLNEIFITDELTQDDMVNHAYTIRDKICENKLVMQQIETNTAEQAMLGDFPKAIDDAILNSSDAQQNQMMQLLSDPKRGRPGL
ncbi:MAG: hypothetical protein JXR76_10600 [Deltaproteobacteria bacterium]|nr:hypothetical protein [Deltaproteobacteria bacterium]